MYGHLEVKCLFITVFGSVEPADELVCAAFWFLRSSYRGVVRNLFPCVQRIFLVYSILCQEGFNGMGSRRPLGVEDHIRRGHCHCVEIDLGTFETINRRVPPGKHKGVWFKFCRVARLEIVFFQRCLVLYAPALSFNFGIIVEEGQVVAVAGIAEVVIGVHPRSLSALFHFVKCWVRPILRKAGNVVELFGICQPSALLNVDFLIELEVFPVVGVFPRLTVQRFNVVPEHCTGISTRSCERNAFTRHGVNAAQLRIRLEVLAVIRYVPPKRFISLFDGEVAVDIRAILGGDGQVRSFIASVAMGMLG